jgi:hypothetical protein
MNTKMNTKMNIELEIVKDFDQDKINKLKHTEIQNNQAYIDILMGINPIFSPITVNTNSILFIVWFLSKKK